MKTDFRNISLVFDYILAALGITNVSYLARTREPKLLYKRANVEISAVKLKYIKYTYIVMKEPVTQYESDIKW